MIKEAGIGTLLGEWLVTMETSGEGVTMSPTVEKEEKKIPSIFKHCL